MPVFISMRNIRLDNSLIFCQMTGDIFSKMNEYF